MTFTRLIPYGTGLMAAVADHLLTQADDGYDLSHLVVLLPPSMSGSDLRRELIRRAPDGAALLGPTLTTLRQWLQSRPGPAPSVLTDQACELALVEALQGHTALFGEDSPWRIAETLRELFTEMSLQQARLPDSLDDWVGQLGQAYGITTDRPEPLLQEARMVHQLWQAWRQQLDALQQEDMAGFYVQRLQQHLEPSDDRSLVLVGLQPFSRPERHWIQHQLDRGRLTWFVQASQPGGLPERPLADLLATRPPEPSTSSTPLQRFLDRLFPDRQHDMRSRAARQCADEPGSPLVDHYHCLTADNPEQEARAIELQVRLWLLEGVQPIGVVTEDRRLARRVRALLERAGIDLQDTGGWALSTTSAAAVLERWLECLEEDFAHLPFLDLLKSPMLFPDTDREAHLTLVYRLEQDVIQREHIGRSLNRYRQHLDYRLQRLNQTQSEAYDQLRALLDRIETGADPLRDHLTRTRPAADLLQALQQSLETLGIWQSWNEDAAGQRLISLLEGLRSAADTHPLELDWAGFRAWLGGNLERTTFRPAQTGGPVRLMTLEQSQGQVFAGLILGGCDRNQLPGRASGSPFFNDAVRHDLGLSTWTDEYALKLYHFRRILEAAPRLLFTYHHEDQGEPVLPSPWLDALLSFHELSYGNRLEAISLRAMLARDDVEVTATDAGSLPGLPEQPRPALQPELRPDRVSPSSHQHLIDCPYQYFAADCLRLQAPEPVREALAKSDYGERIHRCLEAFHSDVNELPGPFRAALSRDNRGAAIQVLNAIAEAVFADDLEDNFQHRGWLKRWQAKIPEYIDWQIDRQQLWRVRATEKQNEQQLAPDLRLRGRIDRIDAGEDGLAILDYKTGRTPSQDEVLAGEAVQLPLYAVLSEEPVAEVAYVKLDGQRVKTGEQLDGDELTRLTDAVRQRLLSLHDALGSGSPMPAWGDPVTCAWCDMRGLCRKDIWEN